MTEERVEARLVALVNGDVVGFSRLTAEDPDATLEALAERRRRVGELVADHRGRLADFTGDNFLAEFPSATDALRCAVAIQRAGAVEQARVPEDRRIRFRLGVHLGEVRAQEGRIVGDGVNAAARLEAIADPGGICEELTTDLSRSPGLFVISRSSAFSYKGGPVKIADVARELGVRYVLEGSVRRAGGRVRITAQLVDATTDFHVWSEQYDRELRDIFSIQSEISAEI